jgi:toxin ParE1/3/4
MARGVILSPRAQRWIDAQLDYLEEHSLDAARRLLERLNGAMRQLADFPHSGSRGKTPGTRRLIVAPYVLTYRNVSNDLVEIIDIRHVRQRETPLPDEPGGV